MSAAVSVCGAFVAHPARPRATSGRRVRGGARVRSSVVMASSAADTSVADEARVPALAVFDLDACLWNQEMFQLRVLVDRENPVMGPLTPGGDVGVVGARSGGDIIKLHPGALHALQRFHAGDYPGMRCAAASSADTPLAVSIGRSALDLLEVVPGVTVREVLAMGFERASRGTCRSDARRPCPRTKRRRTSRSSSAKPRSRLTRCSSSTTATGATTARRWRTGAERKPQG